MLLTTFVYPVWVITCFCFLISSSYPSSSRKKNLLPANRLLAAALSIRAFRDWLRCKKPSPSRSDHPSGSCLLFLSMLVSIFHPHSFGVNVFSLFYGVTFVAHMRKRFCFVLNTKLMLILTTTVTHQTLYFPCDRGYCYMAHAASLMVWFLIIDGYRTSSPKSLLCSITPM
jgi:hypothetical protein